MVKKSFFLLVGLLIILGIFPFLSSNENQLNYERIPSFNIFCEYSLIDGYTSLREIGSFEKFESISFKPEFSRDNYVCHGKIIGSNVTEGIKLDEINNQNLELIVNVNSYLIFFTIFIPLFYLLIVENAFKFERKNYDFRNYRSEIDGLRSIAVVLVVGYHLGLKNFNGGYIGVDVFLVISGFLISSIIYNKNKNNEFNLKSFYIRRAKRLLPAVIGTIIIITPPIIIYANPGSILKFSETTIASIFYVSNIFFWFKKQDYFFGFGGKNPLEHTWSLSLEEQYYLIWPILFIFLIRNKNKVYTYLLILLSGLSIYISEIIVSENYNLLLSNYFDKISKLSPFYLIQFRFWEFLIGTLLIFTLKFQLKNKIINDLVIIFSILIILRYSLILDSSSPFPGVNALYVCLATYLILQCSNSLYINKLLGSKPFEWIGKRSYSIYLLHWPLIVIFDSLQIRFYNTSKFTLRLILIILILVISDFLYRNVENRYRERSGNVNNIENRIFIKKVAGISIVLVFTMFVVSTNPIRFSLNNQEIKEVYKSTFAVDSIQKINRDEIINKSSCSDFDEYLHVWSENSEIRIDLEKKIFECLNIKNDNILFIGDSMVEDLYVTAKLFRNDINPVLISKCDLFTLSVNNDVQNCIYRKAFIEYLIQEKSDIFSSVIYRVRADKLISEQNRYSEYEFKDYYFEENLIWANELNTKVNFIWVGPNIEHKSELANIFWNSRSIENYKLIAQKEEISNIYTLDSDLENKLAMTNIRYISVIKNLCKDTCPLMSGVDSLYIDEVHWSSSGMKILGNKILKLLF